MAKLKPVTRLAIVSDLLSVLDDPAVAELPAGGNLPNKLVATVKVAANDGGEEKGGSLQTAIADCAVCAEDAGLTIHARFLESIGSRA